jgi:uncharacterized protein (UPF0333 family)
MSIKAQISMEYMLVIAFSLLMILPIILIYGMERQSVNVEITSRQVENIAKKVVDSAETVYYLGKPAKTTLKVYMPQRIENIQIINNTIIFYYQSFDSVAQYPQTANVNITGNISKGPGFQSIKIIACDEYVNITN